ncbi:MAG: hypothetical protein FJ362_03455 [Gemmatimonadetes bacterium]|nr:hypothetical protein [Gemmatimonadota bacterium]
MIRSLTQQVVLVAMLASLTVSIAEAQSGGGSDFTGPGGGGGGAGGSVAPIGVPVGPPTGPITSAGSAGISGVASTFGNPGAGGLSISNPAGGTVTIAPATARAIAAVLSSGGGAAAPALANLLTAEGMAAGPATALANALAALGTNPSRANLVAAIEAFNAAIDAGTGAPSPSLLAVRFAIASASR